MDMEGGMARPGVKGESRVRGTEKSSLSTWKKPHSKRVEKIENYTRFEWRRLNITLETSGEYTLISSIF
jgi:hypothetical protein